MRPPASMRAANVTEKTAYNRSVYAAPAVAIAYAREGVDVAINYLPQEESDAAEVIGLIRREGRKAVAIPGDLRTEEFCRKLVARAERELGGLDILVNNAGYGWFLPDILEHPSEKFDQTIKTNLYAPFWLSKAAIAVMKPGSSIVSTSSVTASRQRLS